MYETVEISDLNLLQFLRADISSLIDSLENHQILSKYQDELLNLLKHYEYIFQDYYNDHLFYLENLDNGTDNLY